jgi:fimbrial chaperone protein
MVLRTVLKPLPAAFLAAALATFLAAGAARAQSLTIQPVSVTLAAGQMAATLTVLNQSPAPSAFQVRAYEWRAVDGEDQLVPTEAIALSPPLGTIAPNASQLIRLVLRRPAKDREETYRIWLDQIPAASEPGTVRIALRFSIPVFAQPAARISPQLQWRVTSEGEKYFLVASNSGARHQAVRNLVLAMPDGRAVKTEGSISPYVLAGATRRWPLVTPPPPGTLLKLTATTDEGALDQTVAVSAR